MGRTIYIKSLNFLNFSYNAGCSKKNRWSFILVVVVKWLYPQWNSVEINKHPDDQPSNLYVAKL